MAKLKCGECNRVMQSKNTHVGASIYRLEIFGQVISGQTFDTLMECPGCGLIAYVVINKKGTP